jgi:hypothetical protein
MPENSGEHRRQRENEAVVADNVWGTGAGIKSSWICTVLHRDIPDPRHQPKSEPIWNVLLLCRAAKNEAVQERMILMLS